MSFHVGQKVGCVDARPYLAAGFPTGLRLNAIYTIRYVGVRADRELVLLDELPGGWETAFYSTRFRPLTERKTDISIFTALLNPSKPNRQKVSHDLCGNE